MPSFNQQQQIQNIKNSAYERINRGLSLFVSVDINNNQVPFLNFIVITRDLTLIKDVFGYIMNCQEYTQFNNSVRELLWINLRANDNLSENIQDMMFDVCLIGNYEVDGNFVMNLSLGRTLIMEWILMGNMDIAVNLIHSLGEFTKFDATGNTVLHYAAYAYTQGRITFQEYLDFANFMANENLRNVQNFVDNIPDDIVNFFNDNTEHDTERDTGPFKYSVYNGPTDNLECFCLSENENGPFVKMDNCDHIFHESCIETWTRTARTCPLCRARFFGRRRTYGPTVK